jgi:hypothetical protein
VSARTSEYTPWRSYEHDLYDFMHRAGVDASHILALHMYAGLRAGQIQVLQLYLLQRVVSLRIEFTRYSRSREYHGFVSAVLNLALNLVCIASGWRTKFGTCSNIY